MKNRLTSTRREDRIRLVPLTTVIVCLHPSARWSGNTRSQPATSARSRRDWGYGRDEKLTKEDLIRERYRGIRPAPGYPSCPDHSEKRALFELTESYAMSPAASVCGLYFAHPEARYFAVGRLGRDHIESYARRKGLPRDEVERWLRPYLDYEP